MDNLFNAFNNLDGVSSFEKFSDVDIHTGHYEYIPSYSNNQNINPIEYGQTVSQNPGPVYYQDSRFFREPVQSLEWGGTYNAVMALEEENRIPAILDRIDPNKIFTSDQQSLKTLAADQLRIVTLFDKKLRESLNDKNKMGLTEEDINALSALTTARSAITAIAKEQVAIKKNIADIRIKQQERRRQMANAQENVQGQQTQGSSGDPFDSTAYMDNIFSSATSNANDFISKPPESYIDGNVDSSYADNFDMGKVSNEIRNEAQGVDRLGVILNSDKTEIIEFVPVDKNGNKIDNPDIQFNAPDIHAKYNIDIGNNVVHDSALRTYVIVEDDFKD